MTQPTKPSAPVPDSSGNPRQASEHQETLLLTDVPEASALMPEAFQAPVAPAAHIGSQAVRALSKRYEILAEAGHGSMGNVYKARDRETGETLALKLLKPEIASDQAMTERFKNELLFARKITHKNVCRVYDFNRIEGIAYTSMEFVEGESLRSVLNRFGGLPTRKGTDLILQICSGLKEAHAQGIVHRDLKPENVMIDGQGNVKIMDFGIARSMEAGTRLTGSMVGTPAYMAPEQVAGKPVDYRTDIYSLGLIMYEVFTGTPAFQADNAVAVALKQMREAPRAPHEVEPNVPPSIERAILKCLQKEPPSRFQSIGELENALRTPAAPTASPANLADIPFNRSGQPTVAFQPLNSAAVPKPKRTSWPLWFLLLFFLLAALGALRADQIKQFADNMRPPAPPSAPAPPSFALDVTSAPDSDADATAQPEPAKLVEAKPAKPDATPVAKVPAPKSPKPAEAQAKEASTTEAEAVKNPRDAATGESAQPDVQQRADKAFGEARTNPAASVAPAVPDGQSYLWVGRFENEGRAQGAARKIEGLGLPATVVPRHNENGPFWVVLTGPFGAKRVPSVIEWLQAQGFPNVRQVPGFVSSVKQNQ